MRFVIITPAHNEEAFIELTIKSMIAQTVKPLQWIIVNDASSDATASIVARYVAEHPFIKLVNRERAPGRHFAHKANAFAMGIAQLDARAFDFIGNLDADVSFAPEYFANILKAFAQDPTLGIAGGMIYSRMNGKYVSQQVATDSVAGAVQLFRAACFAQVDGYMLLPHGGIDTAAEVTARMRGWKVRTLDENRVLEHRRTGSAVSRPLAARVKEGRRMHALGYDFWFFLARCVFRSLESPVFIGSLAALWGFLASKIAGVPLSLPPHTVHFLRTEQRRKLFGRFGRGPSPRSEAYRST